VQQIKSTLQTAVKQLSATSPSAQLDVELLLSVCLKKPRSYLHAWPEQALSNNALQCFAGLLQRRLQGEPIAYILQQHSFWSLALTVTPATLIPRPETELLVTLCLARLPESACRVAELGTGCGAVALALAEERPQWHMDATDQSPAALTIAQANAARLGLDQVQFYQGDWCQALPHTDYHAIVSNPPYIAVGDPHLQQGDVRFEPQAALVSGADGLMALTAISRCARDHLQPGGWLMLEHGYDQHDAVTSVLRTLGYQRVKDYNDLAGLPRVVVGQYQA